MSRRKRKKLGKATKYNEIELNIMPFIDVFSILNTFLLMAAVFISIGFHEVQIPYLSSVPPDKKVPQRAIAVNIDLEIQDVKIRTSFSPGPPNAEEFSFKTDEAGMANFHKKLIEIRTKNPETDLASMYIMDDDVNYELITKTLDAVKLVNEEDPPIPLPAPKEGEVRDGNAPQQLRQALYPKVVFSNVIL